jgi:hypothetical protein
MHGMYLKMLPFLNVTSLFQSVLSSDEIKSELMDNDVQTVVPDAEAEDDELLKSEEKEERTVPQEYEDDRLAADKRNSQRPILLKQHLRAIAVKVAPHWKKLASKLGYQADEVWT